MAKKNPPPKRGGHDVEVQVGMGKRAIEWWKDTYRSKRDQYVMGRGGAGA